MTNCHENHSIIEKVLNKKQISIPNRSSSVLEHFNSRDQRTEKLHSPLYLPPPPSHTGPSILSMAIPQQDPHNPTDVEVLDLYYPLIKTSDIVVFDLPSDYTPLYLIRIFYGLFQ